MLCVIYFQRNSSCKKESSQLQHMTACEECTSKDCKSLGRIIKISNAYDLWIENNTGNDEDNIINILKSSFEFISHEQIINDYNHIKHKKYNLSSSDCNQSSSSQCISLTHHKRNNNMNLEVIHGTSDIKEILFQKMLDQIHIYFCSFCRFVILFSFTLLQCRMCDHSNNKWKVTVEWFWN